MTHMVRYPHASHKGKTFYLDYVVVVKGDRFLGGVEYTPVNALAIGPTFDAHARAHDWARQFRNPDPAAPEGKNCDVCGVLIHYPDHPIGGDLVCGQCHFAGIMFVEKWEQDLLSREITDPWLIHYLIRTARTC